ncbi:MAG: HPP family protein [Rhizobiales bacterium]|nr:HPP family protein [Hyphomicrobiales bacterium]
MRDFFYRHQPPMHVRSAVFAGAGAAIAILVLALMGFWLGGMWLMAPFGASAVLLFAAPTAVLSQPINLVGGNIVAACVSLPLAALWPDQVWLAAVACGATISLTVLLRVVHPPAGATALVIYLTKASWTFFFVPVLAGSLVLVFIAWGWHRVVGGTYPLKSPP